MFSAFAGCGHGDRRAHVLRGTGDLIFANQRTRFGFRQALYATRRHLYWSCDMVFRPRDLADRMAARRKPDDGYLRETFILPRDRARTKARDFLARYPKAAYMSSVESWREHPNGDIEFTMRRLRSAD
jgi:molybdopterin-guanine dinucleotide biosynthesis protein A